MEIPVIVPAQVRRIGQKASTVVKVLWLIGWRKFARSGRRFGCHIIRRRLFALWNGDINQSHQALCERQQLSGQIGMKLESGLLYFVSDKLTCSLGSCPDTLSLVSSGTFNMAFWIIKSIPIFSTMCSLDEPLTCSPRADMHESQLFPMRS